MPPEVPVTQQPVLHGCGTTPTYEDIKATGNKKHRRFLPPACLRSSLEVWKACFVGLKVK